MRTELAPPVTIDLSGERCARNVRALSSMTRSELESFLGATVRAASSIVLVRAPRSKPEKTPRTPRHKLRRDRWR
jgi:hypothetical protein